MRRLKLNLLGCRELIPIRATATRDESPEVRVCNRPFRRHVTVRSENLYRSDESMAAGSIAVAHWLPG